MTNSKSFKSGVKCPYTLTEKKMIYSRISLVIIQLLNSHTNNNNLDNYENESRTDKSLIIAKAIDA